jgi:D-sedoheptulose 7-phosphate isomerase
MLNVKVIIQDSAEVKVAMLEHCADDISRASQLMIDVAKGGKKIFWCGNGGSAADAQHMAAELMGGLRAHDRPAIASVALTTDSSFVTAWANDTDYESIFSRQLEGLGETGDVLVAISTSGNSANVISAIGEAKSKGIYVIVLTGKSGGKMANTGDVTICIPSDDTQRIQEGHLLAEHIMCESVEAAIMAG